jgi:class 3 adenylate cyclase
MTAATHFAAILAANVVSRCRLPCDDDTAAAETVRERRETAIQIVRSLGGRILRTTEDGVAVKISTVAAAVECGTLIQKMMAERNLGLAEGERILFRIGINLGAALIGDDGVLSDAVNIATQLEACGEPGGVCLSSSAFERMRGRIDAEFIDLGEQSLRNIANLACTCLMHVYELTPTAIAAVRIQGLDTVAFCPTGQASGTLGRGWLTRWRARRSAV